MSEKRRLWPGPHAGKVRVFAIPVFRPGRVGLFLRLSLRAARFFFLLLGVFGPLTIAFREGCLSWSGDRNLLAGCPA
jgi:hypothetical protein